MTDYYIKCVNKNADGNIESVGYGPNIDETVHNVPKPKEKVIEDIDDKGKTVVTSYYSNRQGEWVKGDDVHTVKGRYIRTDGNNIESDNLENLKECTVF